MRPRHLPTDVRLATRIASLVAALVSPAALADEAGAVGHPPSPSTLPLALLDLKDASVQTAVPTIGFDGTLSLTLTLDEQPVVLSAVPHSLRAPGFRLIAASGPDGQEVQIEPPSPTTWRGAAVGHEGSIAALSLVEGGVRGIMRVGGRTWGIQPLRDIVPDAEAALHVVYRSDQIAAPPHECGGSPFAEGVELEGAPDGGLAGGGVCDNMVQIAIDADREYFVANGSSIANTVADIESVMNGVDAIFINDVAITSQITQIRVWTAEPDPYTSTAAGTLLNEFRTWWNTNEGGIVRDVAHLFTGKNLNGTTIGIAYLSAVCNLPSAYGLTQGKWSSNLVLRTATVTHELGHNWSAPHCNSDPACAIMCSGIGGCTGQMTLFEQGTKNKIVQFRNAIGCLGPGPQSPPMAKDDVLYAMAGSMEVLDVLANDLELNCEDLTIVGLPATSAAGAILSICDACSSSGGPAVVYEPPAGFTGTDGFQYTAMDEAGNTDSALVQVTVVALRPADLVPPAAPGLFTTVYLLPPLTQLPDFSSFTPFSTWIYGLIFFPATNDQIFLTGQSDNVGVVFEGFLEAPASDLYTIFLESDDGSRLWIGDTLVVDNDGLHGMVEVSGTIGLQAGKHRVRVEYWEESGASGIIASWKSSTLQKSIIPSARWSYVIPGDLNGDQKVNGADLGILLTQWDGPGTADFDGDGVVDGADLGILLAAWKP